MNEVNQYLPPMIIGCPGCTAHLQYNLTERVGFVDYDNVFEETGPVQEGVAAN